MKTIVYFLFQTIMFTNLIFTISNEDEYEDRFESLNRAKESIQEVIDDLLEDEEVENYIKNKKSKLLSKNLSPSKELQQAKIFIRRHNPSLGDKKISEILSLFRTASIKYNIPFRIYIVTASIESSYKIDAINRNGSKKLKHFDIGTFQQSVYWGKKTIKNLNTNKLLRNIEYQTEVFSQFVSILKRRHGKNYIGYYHSYTPKHRLRYSKVFLRKIKELNKII